MHRTLFLVLLLLLVVSSAPAATRAVRHVGMTSKQELVSLRLSPDGRSIQRLRLEWSDSCDPRRGKFTVLDRSDRIRVTNGRFRAVRSYVETGTGRRVTIRVKGTIRRNRSSGAFSVRSRSGAARCVTGSVRWQARRIG